MAVLERSEEIARAFDHGAKACQDKGFPYPPADWPEHAQEEWRTGYSWAEWRLELFWGRAK